MAIKTGKEAIILLLFNEPKANKIRKVTRTYIEKMLFLLNKEANFEIGDYHYKPDDYGPCAGEMYDDLELLLGLDIIKTHQGTIDVIDKLDNESHKQNIDDFESPDEKKETLYYELTTTGKKVATRLYNELNDAEKTKLNHVKHEFGSFPLADIIRYVYNKYPEFTDKSKIKKEILFNSTLAITPRAKLARFRRE